jgi:lysozyme
MRINLKIILLSKLLLILNLCMFVCSGFLVVKDKEELKAKQLIKTEENVLITNPMQDWNDNYEKTLRFIKKNEGFAGGKAYICPGGYKTIGYGHVILEGETYEELTENQADSLLRVDFNKAIKRIDQIVDLPGNRKLAIAHFVFTRGIGTFLKSNLKDRVLKGEPIEEELLKMCYYTNSSGERIKSQLALKIRKWEIDLYNQNS